MGDEARRRQQRQIARAHHPDVGGDPAQYLRLVQGLADDRPRSTIRPVTKTPKKFLRNGVRRSRLLIRTARARLPRSVPGARRYIDL